MNKPVTQVRRFSKNTHFTSSYCSGVSLHSHTMHSKDGRGGLPAYIAKFPIGGYIIERELGRLHLHKGWNFDFNKYYWTPPLSPREAYELEGTIIEKDLELKPLVSLSDHDNIEAGLHLRMLGPTRDVPVSVEWTAPYEETIFHIGVHNLPPARATSWMTAFAEYTAKPDAAKLGEFLRGLNAHPAVLVVLNHPYWDAESLGPETHRRSLQSFLATYQSFLHALELNGM